MGKIVRHEFLGNRLVVLFFVITGIGIPLAVIYLLESLVKVEEEMENPSEFLRTYRASSKPGSD